MLFRSKQAQREAIRNGEPWPAPDADEDEELRPNLNAPDLPTPPVAADANGTSES